MACVIAMNRCNGLGETGDDGMMGWVLGDKSSLRGSGGNLGIYDDHRGGWWKV